MHHEPSHCKTFRQATPVVANLSGVSAPSRPALPFERLGDYSILAPISEGGMASVWLGKSLTEPDRLVALKVIRPEHGRDREFVEMFLDETRIASRLSHPNVIAIHGSGHDGHRHFLAMEVLRGHTLLEAWEAAHARGRRLPYDVVAWIGARIADGLHHAHELEDENGLSAQVVHRDVNPANIFLTRDGVPKLIDFGLAKARDRVTTTGVGIIKGKLAYLAPEQAQGHPIDRRADVFALGITLWEVTLDRRLFKENSDVETLRRVREAQVPDPRSLDATYPPVLAEALSHALARDPEQRFATAAELREALDAFAREGARQGKATVDADAVRDLLRDLFEGAPPPEWERVALDAAENDAGIRVWDDEEQKLTWIQASVETVSRRSAPKPPPPLVRATPAPPGTGPASPAPPRRDRLDAALAEWLANPALQADRVSLARAHLERAVIEEALGDPARAGEHARASLAAWSTSAAHGLARRVSHAQRRAPALVNHIDAEIAACASEMVRADLLAERARLLAAAAVPRHEVRTAWERALDASPSLPAALSGLEAVLTQEPSASDLQALHLARMAEAYAAEPRLAAWLHVERAGALERLGRTESAKSALLQGLELDPGIGPVRAACATHAAVHRDAEWLVELLARHAALEPDATRAAELNLDAACVARYALGDAARSAPLFELAAQGGDPAVLAKRRALDELAALYESSGRMHEALRVRRARLAHLVEPRARAHELRAVAGIEEALADLESATQTLEEALLLAPSDVTLAEALDRLLERLGRSDRRIELWKRVATAAREPRERARRWLRAARIAEAGGEAGRAVQLLRAALAADPADQESTDRLLRLLSPVPSQPAAAATRERIAVHAHAAEHAADVATRVAHLESIALLQEEWLGDAVAAIATFEAILRVEPRRLGALVGLARNAARCGDSVRLAGALLEQAAASTETAVADALRVRAAEALAAVDADRALVLVQNVPPESPANREALRVEQRLHEAAGRWARVDATLGARIESASDPVEQVDLWLARAELQRFRLRSPRDAVASLRAALGIDATHPGALEQMRHLLEAIGDVRMLLEGLEELTAAAPAASDRVHELVRAADIAEHVLHDDARADALYQQALDEMPGDAWLEGRRLRVLRRRAAQGDVQSLVRALSQRVDRDSTPGEASFELAAVHMQARREPARAAPLVEAALAGDPASPYALRTLERAARNAGDLPRLAMVAAQQAEGYATPAPRLAALWTQYAILEWSAPPEDVEPVVDRILQLAPGDRAALDASLRLAWPRARSGDRAARARLLVTLRSRAAQATDDTERLWAHLAMGLLLDGGDDPGGDDPRGALACHRAALAVDARSVIAAHETARLATALGDAEAGVAASLARAELATSARARAALLAQAAGQVVSAQDPRLGSRPERLARAGSLLEQALAADPETVPAVALLVAVRTEDGGRDRLLTTLRTAFERSQAPPVIAALGAEIARVATTEPMDRGLAITALRRVLGVVPDDARALRALVDHLLAQGARVDAIEALETLAKQTRDPRARLAALFELADHYGASPAQAADAARVLRTALEVDPANVVALRRLLDSKAGGAPAAADTVALLERLAGAETAAEPKAEALVRLAQVRSKAGETDGAERALVEAVAQAPTPARLAALLDLHASDAEGQVRTLTAVLARGQQLGRQDAGASAALGRLEGNVLGRWRDAVPHLRAALAMAPAMHEVRAGLAEALLRTGSASEASVIVSSMISPDADSLLSIADPAAAVTTLEEALAAQGRPNEALVARELRALAGGLPETAQVELRARRLAVDPHATVAVSLDLATLRQAVVPHDAPAICFDLALALAGTERKIARTTLDDVRADVRDRLPPTTGHPIPWVAQRLAAALGLPRPELVTAALPAPRIVGVQDALWIAIPQALLAHAEPVQAAAIARPLLRMALGLAWLDGSSTAQTRAVLVAAARQAVSGYGNDPSSPDLRDLLDDANRRVNRAVGRVQKKALTGLTPALASRPALTLVDVQRFERAVAMAEARAAFLLTGDLLATLDAIRATDPALAAATQTPGVPALAAALRHPIAGDVARYALTTPTTSLRRRTGTLWVSTTPSVPPPR
jgi:serine/threonine protein kinase